MCGAIEYDFSRICLGPMIEPHRVRECQGMRAETGSPRISTSATLCLCLRHLPALVSDGCPGPQRSSGTGSENGRCP